MSTTCVFDTWWKTLWATGLPDHRMGPMCSQLPSAEWGAGWHPMHVFLSLGLGSAKGCEAGAKGVSHCWAGLCSRGCCWFQVPVIAMLDAAVWEARWLLVFLFTSTMNPGSELLSFARRGQRWPQSQAGLRGTPH